MKGEKLRVAVLGASGYTGADALRLLARHPRVEVHREVPEAGNRVDGDEVRIVLVAGIAAGP